MSSDQGRQEIQCGIYCSFAMRLSKAAQEQWSGEQQQNYSKCIVHQDKSIPTVGGTKKEKEKRTEQNKTNSDVRSIFKAVQLLVHQSMNMNEEIPQLLFAVGSSTGKSPLLG